jgi:hypothetical protein
MLNDYSQLDAEARKRIDAACGFLNHKLRQQRNRVLMTTAWCAFGAIAVAAFLRIPPWVPLAVALLIVLLVAVRAHAEVKRWFKSMVVQRVVEALGTGLTYSRESSFDRASFTAMDLFSERTDVFRSEDEVRGTDNQVAFALHEAWAAKREKRGKHTHTIVFFRGTIVVLEFNKHFHGHTTVVPEAAHGLLGGLFGEFDSRKGRERVSMQDAAFEQAFSVYSSDAQQAHYLLTPKMLQLILETKSTMANGVRLAFRDNMLYVAVPSTQNRFEVSLFTTKVTPQQVIGDLGSALQLVQRLIAGLDLETRIWTRV